MLSTKLILWGESRSPQALFKLISKREYVQSLARNRLVQVNFGKKLSPSKAFTVLHQESLTQRAKFYVPFSDIKYLLNTLNSATDCAQCAVCADLLVRFKENDVTKAGTGYYLQIWGKVLFESEI